MSASLAARSDCIACRRCRGCIGLGLERIVFGGQACDIGLCLLHAPAGSMVAVALAEPCLHRARQRSVLLGRNNCDLAIAVRLAVVLAASTLHARPVRFESARVHRPRRDPDPAAHRQVRRNQARAAPWQFQDRRHRRQAARHSCAEPAGELDLAVRLSTSAWSCLHELLEAAPPSAKRKRFSGEVRCCACRLAWRSAEAKA